MFSGLTDLWLEAFLINSLIQEVQACKHMQWNIGVASSDGMFVEIETNYFTYLVNMLGVGPSTQQMCANLAHHPKSDQPPIRPDSYFGSELRSSSSE